MRSWPSVASRVTVLTCRRSSTEIHIGPRRRRSSDITSAFHRPPSLARIWPVKEIGRGRPARTLSAFPPPPPPGQTGGGEGGGGAPPPGGKTPPPPPPPFSLLFPLR